MQDELLYQIALTMLPELGPVKAKILIEHFESATAIFKARKKEISAIEGIGELNARILKDWNRFNEVEAEIQFIERHHIETLFLTDDAYPQRLLHCYDPPTLLYYRGNAKLNCAKIVSIIGTRNHTEYGKQVTEQIVQSLQSLDVLIISGLAFGIDAIAHRASLQNELATIGVLAHGMDTIYPAQHKTLAKEMMLHGGLLTEFRKNTKPDKHNFPKRNRIVAGMADATIVIETAVKGGSMITAELANNYNRDLFAIPGKISDTKSSGCLTLISQNKATLFSSTKQFIELMGWEEKKKNNKKQRSLFIELSAEEKIIVNLLNEKEVTPIDQLFIKSGLSCSTVASAILNLEMQNVICALPGKLYQLV